MENTLMKQGWGISAAENLLPNPLIDSHVMTSTPPFHFVLSS
jgi:hypothetical protein